MTQQSLISRISMLQDKISAMREKYYRLLMVENAEFDGIMMPESIIIYGVGDIGKIFYEKIKTRYKVECFLDSYSQETEYDGIPVIRPDKKANMVGKMIVVVPVYDYDKIAEMLEKLYGSTNSIVSLNEFCRNAEKNTQQNGV